MTKQALEPRLELGHNLTRGLLDVIGRAIVIGHYEDTIFPTEADLAKQYGVSRSVTREAVKMLTAKGLLSARPRQGTIVQPKSGWNLFDTDVLRWLLERKFSIELWRHITELRVGVEPEAAALAAANADSADKGAISAGLARVQAAEQGLDDPLEADIAFHMALLKATKNPFYSQFSAVVATALRTSIRFTNRIKGRTANTAEHRAVYDGVIAGNGASARRAMANLLKEVTQLIVDAELAEKEKDEASDKKKKTRQIAAMQPRA